MGHDEAIQRIQQHLQSCDGCALRLLDFLTCEHRDFDEDQDGHMTCRGCGLEAQTCPDCGNAGKCEPTCPQAELAHPEGEEP